jgi:hypothetical protein
MPLGDLPMVWKFVERSSAVLGVVLTAVCAYYAVATYYGWNTLAPSTPMHTEASVTPPWWLYAAIVIGLGLIATGWTMIFTRRQGKRKQQLALFFDPKDERCQRIHGPGIYTHVLAFNLTSKELKNCEVFLTELQLSDKVGNWASVGFFNIRILFGQSHRIQQSRIYLRASGRSLLIYFTQYRPRRLRNLNCS